GPVKAGAGGVAAARMRGSPARPVPMPDPALDALMLPFADRRLAWPAAGALFLRPRAAAALQAHAPRERVVGGPSFPPAHAAPQPAGFQVRAGGGDAFPLVLALPPRQRDGARALLARALARTAPGGRVVAAMANDAGARSGQADFEALLGPAQSMSKYKSRVFW